MRPLPDLTDPDALVRTGKRSLLMRARNEACEALRDAAVTAQGQDISGAGEGLDEAIAAVARLKEIAALWKEIE